MSKIVIIIVCLLTFLLPLASNLLPRSGSVFLSVFALLGIYAWITRKTAPAFDINKRRVLWVFALYFAVNFFFYIIHGIISPHETFRWDPGHEVCMLAFIPVYYLFYRTGLKFWVLWYGTAIASIIFGIQAILSVYGFTAALPVPDAHSASFGEISAISGFIALSGFGYFHRKHPMLILLPVLAFSSGILAACLSPSRGAVAGIPPMAIIFFMQLGRAWRPWRCRIIFIIALGVLSAGIYQLPGSGLEEKMQIRSGQNSGVFHGAGPESALRYRLWKAGWKLFVQHPLLGAGKHGYEHAVTQETGPGQIPPDIGRLDSPKNMYLAEMAAYGITGLVILLAIFFAPCLILIPGTRVPGPAGDFAFAGIMLVAGYMSFSVFQSVFYQSVNTSFYIILLAAILCLTACGREYSAPE